MIILGSVVGVAVTVPTAASADDSARREVPPRTSYSIVKHTKKKDVTDWGRRIGSCKAASKGVTCHVTATRTATRTIGTSFNVSTKWVAGELNISASKSQAVSAGCSAKLKKGQTLAAYPRGSQHRYKIRKTVRWAGGGVGKTDSGWKHTYNPYKTQITCKVI